MITRAIRTSEGKFEGLLLELEATEADIKQVKRQLAQLNDIHNDVGSLSDFKTFARQQAGELKRVLGGDREIAQQALRRMVKRLILTPVQTPRGSAFEVTGDIDLFAGGSGGSSVMLSATGTHCAKYYGFALSLTGLQLDPGRTDPVPDSSGGEGSMCFLPPLPNESPGQAAAL